MDFLKLRLKAMITKECNFQGIDSKYVQQGVERGEYFLTKGNSISSSAKEGILMASNQQRLTNFHKRTITKLHSLNDKLERLKRHIKAGFILKQD